MAGRLRRKTLEQTGGQSDNKSLVRSLGWPHLVALGIGGIIGAGIYTLIGTAADKAGPAVLLAFVIAGFICTCAAFAYAELGTMIHGAGGAYTYTYAACGEVLAWIVGWSTVFGFLLVPAVVSSGWSAYFSPYFVHFAAHFGVAVPSWLLRPYSAGGLVNLPAVFIVFLVALFLFRGTKESAVVNAVLVVLKIGALLLFAALALPHFNAANLTPFMPHGFAKTIGADGVERGVMAAAAAVFFAFYGFDTVANAAEETVNPERNLSIGIVGSLAGCIILYIMVSLAAVAAVPFAEFANKGDALAYVLHAVGSVWGANAVSLIAVIALPTVILAFVYSLARLFFSMGRDGLLPPALTKMGDGGVPVATTLLSALLIALFGGFLPINKIADYANAGPLFTFAMVGICLLLLRYKYPDAKRGFKVPLVWLIGLAGIAGCIYLFWNLPNDTKLGFLAWNVLGLIIYAVYGRRKSRLAGGGR